MPGANSANLTYRLSSNVRVAKYTGLVKDATDSTATRFFASVPTAPSGGNGPWQKAPAGVTLEQYVEPNQFYPEDTDPTTITGTTPSGGYTLGGTGVGLDRGITLAERGARIRCYAAGAINAGDKVCIADQYGRVNNYANLALAGGTRLFTLGTAVSKSTAANDVIFVDLNPGPDTV